MMINGKILRLKKRSAGHYSGAFTYTHNENEVR